MGALGQMPAFSVSLSTNWRTLSSKEPGRLDDEMMIESSLSSEPSGK